VGPRVRIPVCRPRVRIPICRPRVRVPVHDRDCLPVHAGHPGD
ncbi:hypothetical protein Taro_056403, partial [Colocasia esculenta]|nr:hypothetical protein [Colocasia esculenta]